MQPTNTIAELIQSALSAGYSRVRLIELAGCSRMQFWRLASGKSGANSAAAKRLRLALSRVPDNDTSVDETLTRLRSLLTAVPPDRRASALQMLHAVTHLLA
jgi:hypothetical protein